MILLETGMCKTPMLNYSMQAAVTFRLSADNLVIAQQIPPETL